MHVRCRTDVRHNMYIVYRQRFVCICASYILLRDLIVCKILADKMHVNLHELHDWHKPNIFTLNRCKEFSSVQHISCYASYTRIRNGISMSLANKHSLRLIKTKQQQQQQYTSYGLHFVVLLLTHVGLYANVKMFHVAVHSPIKLAISNHLRWYSFAHTYLALENELLPHSSHLLLRRPLSDLPIV